MENQDRQVIQGLFMRLEDVARQGPPRDVAAEEFIRQQIAQQPAAPYYMAQTIVMQEYALNQAQQRLEELERAPQERRAGGGIFSGLFGGGPKAGPANRLGANATRAPFPQQGGNGFLAGAAQTAMGVAGGVLLGNAIAGLFGGNEASAAENAPTEATDEEASADDNGFSNDDFGGDEF